MSETTLKYLEIEPDSTPNTTVFWLHGLGDTGHGHEDVVRALKLKDSMRCRFILPHAPSIPVTLNMGMVMPAWYDIKALGDAARHDAGGIAESHDQIVHLMKREVTRGIPYGRQVLAGFSQGGVIAMDVAFHHREKVLGVIALSTYLIEREAEEPLHKDIPAFVGHGTYDPMVPIQAAHQSRDILEERGNAVSYREYPMEHSLCLEEIQDISEWLGGLDTIKE